MIERLRVPFHWWSRTRRVSTCAIIGVLTWGTGLLHSSSFSLQIGAERGQGENARRHAAKAQAGESGTTESDRRMRSAAAMVDGHRGDRGSSRPHVSRAEADRASPGHVEVEGRRIAQIGALAERTGLEIDRLAPLKSASHRNGVVSSVSVSAQGEFAAVADWVERVERLEGFASFERLTLARATDGARVTHPLTSPAARTETASGPASSRVSIVADLTFDPRFVTGRVGPTDNALVLADAPIETTESRGIAIATSATPTTITMSSAENANAVTAAHERDSRRSPFDSTERFAGRLAGRIRGEGREVTLMVGQTPGIAADRSVNAPFEVATASDEGGSNLEDLTTRTHARHDP
ncbi:protein of unknown function [Pararobbsia alpina]|uniref:hypothetical protein n=1 Tax=Pararobbsia alpina TaxID=621374 RepID=UPI0039A583DC